jgi:hypothetical protein
LYTPEMWHPSAEASTVRDACIPAGTIIANLLEMKGSDTAIRRGGRPGNAVHPVGPRDQRGDRQALQRRALAVGVGELSPLRATAGNRLDRGLRRELSGYDRYATSAGNAKADTAANSCV